MFQVSWKIGSVTLTLVITSWLSMASNSLAQTNLQEVIQQIDRYSLKRQETTIPITKVDQLRDVSPNDWSYEALHSFSDRYNCLTGFPDFTYRGNQALSRDEFAVGLNSCLEQIENFTSSSRTIFEEDIKTIKRLIEEFETEITNLSRRSHNLANRTDFIEDQQFSTTTKLEGEVILGLASIVAGSQDNGTEEVERVTILGNSITLELETSFNGEDALSIELEAANLPDFADETGTFQGELAFSGSNDNDLELDVLSYTFPLGDNLEIIFGVTGIAADDIAETINFLEGDNGRSGAISNFGGLNPIYETAEDAGLGLIYELGEIIEISAGYLASPANETTGEGGIFNAPYGAIAQITLIPSDRLSLALTYIHSRNQSDTDTGSSLANLQSFTEEELGEAVPTVSDSYGVEFSWRFSDRLVLGGWGGLSKVTTLSTLEGQIDRGTQDVWNWAINLAFPDLIREGNLGGIVIGAEPWVTNSTIDTLGEDADFSLHLEAFYQYRITDNIAITPGIVWITAPDNNNNNDDLVIGAIRTTFSF